VTATREQRATSTRVQEPPSLGEVVDLVKRYAEQETVEPLKGAARWLGFGVVGAFLIGVGLTLVLLGLLRLVQTEWDRAATGSLSWLSYVIVLVVCVALIVLTISRINKNSLNKERK
jgi:hypothetical protein